ncbi:DUF6969 family protein [Nitrogeniibacter mangrovi]|uniref:DUF6969 family protein n=1 Tax=Nitrogeniibacter mangrovi TaxID=2016596 RepID=UPI001570D1CE|nr:hypothetical protein [Nitrogeniibacter mangrovi]
MAAASEPLTDPDLAARLPDPARFSVDALVPLIAAGREVAECQRVLEKGGLNLVGEVLRGQGEFVELEHYPRDDVFDHETHAQYYYHAHRGSAEHGHFHTFLRAPGMPPGCEPVAHDDATAAWPEDEDALSHLIAISMDAWGDPVALFATNRWVTGETWYPAPAVIAMLDEFEIDHAYPSWPVNRWIGALLRLYRPWIEALLHHRDAVVAAWQAAHPDTEVFEDRALDITGLLPIDPPALLERLEAQWAASRAGEAGCGDDL